MTAHDYLHFNPEVEQAMTAGQPVVALESTIIAHGMPYPENIATARRVESIIRDGGAVPATIAILDGKPTVGLDEQELEAVARGKDFLKVSRRDLPLVVANGLNGATTVASTMFVAALAGISVFVTGGIGGVHRQGQDTLDISADLIELATTKVAVISAGAKAILDIGRTLEFLETHGVPVIGYRSDDFPAFYSRQSGFQVDYRVDTTEELARILKVKWDLGLRGGILVANPVPPEYELPRERVEQAIAKALEEAETNRITGKAVTPFLLSRIEKLTGGDSLKTNVELVCDNARVGAGLARDYANVHTNQL